MLDMVEVRTLCWPSSLRYIDGFVHRATVTPITHLMIYLQGCEVVEVAEQTPIT